MKAAIIQHEKSVSAGTSVDWLLLHQIPFTVYSIFESERLPLTDEFDLLFICGGSMNVDQENLFPWLIHEKNFIRQAISEKKIVVGLCLGSQLIAEILGAKVGKHAVTEVGWHHVQILANETSPQNSNLNPNLVPVFQWHEYAFDLPSGCKLLATGEFCRNQAFTFGQSVVAYQFHPESTSEWIQHCARSEDLPQPSASVQSSAQILNEIHYQPALQKWYFLQLDQLLKKNS